MKHFDGQYIKIPLDFISLDMNVYTPSLLPYHIVTLHPINHWNREKKFSHHQTLFKNLSIEYKIKFIKILLKMLKRQYSIDFTEPGFICDYGPFKENIYNYDSENILSNENHSVPCLIGDNFKPFKNKLPELPPIFANNNDNYFSNQPIIDPLFFSHAQRIAENTIQLLFNCTL